MAKVMQFDLHRLLADLLERLEQIVERTHQQNGGDEKPIRNQLASSLMPRHSS